MNFNENSETFGTPCITIFYLKTKANLYF